MTDSARFRLTRNERRVLTYGAVAIIAVLVAAVVALLADEGDPDAAGGGVRDLLAIVEDGDIDVVANGDGTATIRLRTSIEVVCAVSYGTTEALGAIATDTDMAGGGHTDHHPLLVNLEPNTDYFYRLNAIGPEGELYTTELRAFTNGLNQQAAPGTNVAPSGTVVDVSSEFSSSFEAAFAIDGDRATEWSSRGDGDDAYIVVDLGRAVELSGVGFRTREMSDGTSITTSFTVSVDGGAPFGPFEAGVGLAVGEFTATGRIVRVDVETSTGGNTGAVEVEIYEAG